MNIDDSCRQFLSKVALLNTILPVHYYCCCDSSGGKRQRAGPILLRGRMESGEAPNTLESEGPLLATCLSSRRQKKNHPSFKILPNSKYALF